jgi:deoxyadenosine/deoxycytidine kinase
LSGDNLTHITSKHVIHEDMSFTYALFRCAFPVLPRVQISPAEHIRYGWFTPEAAITLDLIPDVDACIQLATRQMHIGAFQLPLLPGARAEGLPSLALLEDPIKQEFHGAAAPSHPGRTWYASFGPPGAGKTTSLKSIHVVLPQMPLVQSRAILNPSSRLNFYLRKAFEEDDPRFFFPFQLEVLPTRFWLSMNAPENALVDGSLFTALAYSRGLYELRLLTPDEYGTFYVNYLSYLQHLTLPRCLFYFHCDADTLQKRIKSRGRRTEHLYSVDYLETLCYAFSTTALELAEFVPMRRIDTTAVDTRRLTKTDIEALYGLPGA